MHCHPPVPKTPYLGVHGTGSSSYGLDYACDLQHDDQRIFVGLEWFPITPSDTPFRAPGHMQTAYPEYRRYTAREYGTRIGFYRLLDAFAKIGAKVSVAANSAIAERYPSIIHDIMDAGHEIIAHSTDMNGTIATGLPVEEERALIARSLDALEQVSGARPRGWHSIARSQSWNTVPLPKELGVEYCCDWANDEMPWACENGLPNYGAIIGKNLTLEGIAEGSRVMLARLLRAVEADRITPVIDKIFPFEQAGEAYAYLKSGAHVGKMLIEID